MSKPKIPYAIDRDGGRITAEDLGLLDPLAPHEMRGHAAMARKRGEGPVFRCPHCSDHLYPRGRQDRTIAHWSHYGRFACPLEFKRRLTRDEVSGIIFRGRQEGATHERLRLLLCRLAERDPLTERGSVSTGKYDKPEQGSGCYPDVFFRHDGRAIVLEVQLAPVSLATIATRRAHYTRQGSFLIWVTENFDQEACMRLFQWDVIADQAGVMFSIDREVVDLIETDGYFRLRRFVYDREKRRWSFAIVLLSELDLSRDGKPLTEPQQWASDFKTTWIEAGEFGQEDIIENVLVPRLFARAELKPEHPFQLADFQEVARVISTLLSIETGRVVEAGYGQNLRHMINQRVPSCFDGRCVDLFRWALTRFQPALLSVGSINNKLKEAEGRCRAKGIKPFGQKSRWGAIRKAVWPDEIS